MFKVKNNVNYDIFVNGRVLPAYGYLTFVSFTDNFEINKLLNKNIISISIYNQDSIDISSNNNSNSQINDTDNNKKVNTGNKDTQISVDTVNKTSNKRKSAKDTKESSLFEEQSAKGDINNATD